ncbi:MAG: ROK family protein, partial [Candidatus Latescibacteria bacterium]|nr:ROK family protein [Candidatus Latescibacterota bacterium]
AGLVDVNGNVLALDKRKTLARESAEAPVKQIVDSIREVVRLGGAAFSDIRGIGIGSPGPLNAKEGKILMAGNLPHWIDFPLAGIIKERVGVNTYIQNDATVFAYGEWWMGAGRGKDDFFAVTLGTGIGGGAVCGGKLLTGFNDNACEIGHITIDYNGPQCWCGQNGCLEQYASATGLVRMTNEKLINVHIETPLAEYRGKPSELTSKEIFEAAKAGDAFACEMFETAGYLLGIGLVNALNLLNFEVVAAGGGLARAGDMILEPARRALLDRGFKSCVKQVKLVPAQRPDDAAILGAVKLVIDMEVNS